jgi:hypothetical protein
VVNIVVQANKLLRLLPHGIQLAQRLPARRMHTRPQAVSPLAQQQNNATTRFNK